MLLKKKIKLTEYFVSITSTATEGNYIFQVRTYSLDEKRAGENVKRLIVAALGVNPDDIVIGTTVEA